MHESKHLARLATIRESRKGPDTKVGLPVRFSGKDR